jgi:hypothetical protein
VLSIGPLDLTFIVLGVALVGGFIAWRLWMGRKRRGDKTENPD